MTRLKDALVAAVVLALGRGERADAATSRARGIVPPRAAGRAAPRRLLLALLAAATVACARVHRRLRARPHRRTRRSGSGWRSGSRSLLLAAACIVIARRLVVTEELDEPYPPPESPADAGRDRAARRRERLALHARAARHARRRRRASARSALAAAHARGSRSGRVRHRRAPAHAVAARPAARRRGRPAARRRRRSRRRRSTRPIPKEPTASSSARRSSSSGCRRPQIRERRDWAPDGIVAYSKICTHAGCAIALYRKPTFADVEPQPGARLPLPLLDVRPGRGGQVLFGPAGRPLPQLPLEIDRAGHLRAAGNFSGPVGPSWWGVRMRKASRDPPRSSASSTSAPARAPLLRKALRYVFPDHWSFLLGEVALYCFVLLVATGIYLTFFFDASSAQTTYHGSYGPLDGATMSHAYASVLHISFSVKAGLLMRQTHHWAANVFVAAIVLHLLRVFFTGAFRKPRDLTYLIGLAMLGLALLEGYLGYSLVDDLLSGMGLAIGYCVALSIPVVGANLANLIWDGAFPGTAAFWSRLYIAHVLILPVLIGGLLAAHLALVAAATTRSSRLTERERAPRRRRAGVSRAGAAVARVDARRVRRCSSCSAGSCRSTRSGSGGPTTSATRTNGAQPDWYLGWLIGALRLVPGFDLTIGELHARAEPVLGRRALPARRLRIPRALAVGRARRHRRPRLPQPARAAAREPVAHGDRRGGRHLGLPDLHRRVRRPRSTSGSGSATRPRSGSYRIAIWIVPVLVGIATKRACEELVAGDRARRVRLQAETAARAARQAGSTGASFTVARRETKERVSFTKLLDAWPVVRQVREGDLLGTGVAARSKRSESLRPRIDEADKVVHSICPFCAVGCGQLVYVEDGEVIQVEGDPASPISRGRLCPKGSATKSLQTSPLRETTVKYRRAVRDRTGRSCRSRRRWT